jgi:hypothetical protein
MCIYKDVIFIALNPEKILPLLHWKKHLANGLVTSLLFASINHDHSTWSNDALAVFIFHDAHMLYLSFT